MSMKLRLTNEQVVDKYLNNVSIRELSKICSCSPNKILKILKDKGVHQSNKRPKGILQLQQDKIFAMHDAGMSCYAISRELGTAHAAIGSIIKKSGRETNGLTADHNNLLKDSYDKILDLYINGTNVYQISKILNRPSGAIYTLLKNNNVEIWDSKYSLNIDYFKYIDTPNKAYILGLMASDGCVRDTGAIRLSLQMGDRHIIESMRTELGYGGPLMTIVRENRKHKDMCLLQVCRMSMYRDLLKLGIIPNKSLILQFPTFNQVPEIYISDYIRGYFDGDGCICVRPKYKSLYCNFVSSTLFIDKLKPYLETKEIVGGRVYKPVRPETSHLYYGIKTEAIKLLNFMYSSMTPTSLYLHRKYKKARHFLTSQSPRG